MSGINEVIAETQAEQGAIDLANHLMVNTLINMLDVRAKAGEIPNWERGTLKSFAESFDKQGSPYAKRILEILK